MTFSDLRLNYSFVGRNNGVRLLCFFVAFPKRGIIKFSLVSISSPVLTFQTPSRLSSFSDRLSVLSYFIIIFWYWQIALYLIYVSQRKIFNIIKNPTWFIFLERVWSVRIRNFKIALTTVRCLKKRLNELVNKITLTLCLIMA